jgi:uroporphyrinogen-III synthase
VATGERAGSGRRAAPRRPVAPPARRRGGLGGATVLAFESRRASEMEGLIRRHGGVGLVAPSMREVPLSENHAARDFLRRLELGEVDVVILLTGVGVRSLAAMSSQAQPPERLAQLLGATTLVARGPKPVPELRKLGLVASVRVPEPNTWREILASLDGEAPVRGRLVAVLEHGAHSHELVAGLEEREAEVLPVPLYRWDLPEDQRPLRHAVAQLGAGSADAALFTAGAQVDHVMRVAEELGLRGAVLEAAGGLLVASVGPVCSGALRRHGLAPDLEPEHPKMGHLVVAVADRFAGCVPDRRPLGRLEAVAPAEKGERR